VAELVPGVATQVTPLVRRVLAPNPGVFTGPGTNTYLVGHEQIAVIDPGPDDESHLDAVAAAGDERIRWILVTHTHPDHAPGAAGLKRRTGARVHGFVARDGFEPDVVIGDGFRIAGPEFALRAVHTPGHASNHLCYLLEDEDVLFSGDHIMSGSTVVITPPDGDMAVYLDSLALVRGLPLRGIAPGHGPFIDSPVAKIDEYVSHRLGRERKVLDALAATGPATVDALVPVVYADVPEDRHPIARNSLWAHLRKLEGDGRARAVDRDDIHAKWSTTEEEAATARKQA
jgi:glyoxylase-like metal-dependent hydrolase (beta-lactamase superfamily II)